MKTHKVVIEIETFRNIDPRDALGLVYGFIRGANTVDWHFEFKSVRLDDVMERLQDHYWDSLAQHKDLILQHVRGALETTFKK